MGNLRCCSLPRTKSAALLQTAVEAEWHVVHGRQAPMVPSLLPACLAQHAVLPLWETAPCTPVIPPQPNLHPLTWHKTIWHTLWFLAAVPGGVQGVMCRVVRWYAGCARLHRPRSMASPQSAWPGTWLHCASPTHPVQGAYASTWCGSSCSQAALCYCQLAQPDLKLQSQGRAWSCPP